jgi:hypothetical protein
MKRLVVLLLVGFTAFTLVGCDDEPASAPKATGSQCKLAQGKGKAACTANQSQMQQAMKDSE